MVKPEELDKAKLNALQSEAARNFAEEKKLEKETKQIVLLMRKNFFGISYASFIKTIVAGIVGAILVVSFGLDNMVKVNTANIIWNKKLENDKDVLQKESEKQQKEKESLQKEVQLVKRERDDLQAELFIAYKTLPNQENTEIKIVKAKLIEQGHRLEEQSSQFAFAEDFQQPLATNAQQIEFGWVYLGTYRSNKWIKKNFNFSWDIQPEALVGKVIQPTVQAVNVRTEKFHGDVIKTIRKGKSAKVMKVEPYPLTDYMWAKIQK
jgi:hypothetical protein